MRKVRHSVPTFRSLEVAVGTITAAVPNTESVKGIYVQRKQRSEKCQWRKENCYDCETNSGSANEHAGV
ncbi:hypothetical protein HBI62_211710 [Parastagonospora nodorum]|nr:hypothetical protein HBI62_211710 [Parastagonospora nodorum]